MLVGESHLNYLVNKEVTSCLVEQAVKEEALRGAAWTEAIGLDFSRLD